MVRLVKKDKSNNVSNKNESKCYIKEGKQVGDLYHVCTLNAFVNHIIDDKELGLKDNLHASGKYTNDLLNTKDIVSFTRDNSFVVPTNSTQFAPLIFQIKVDGNKLSEHYKIYPYQDLKWTGNDPKRSEKEEVVIGPIPNFKSYIKEVHFDIKDINKLIKNKEYVEDLEKVKDYLGSIECTRANLPYKVGGGYKKTASWVFSINTLDELIDRINSSKRLALSDIDTADLLNDYLSSHKSVSKRTLDSLYKKNPKMFTKSILSNLKMTYSNLGIIEFCLEHGADVNIKNENGKTPLYRACNGSNIELVKLLLEYSADPNIPNKNGVTPLKTACNDSNIELVKLLLDHDADPNIKDNYGTTPLVATCRVNSIELVKLLLDHGADPNIVDEDNEISLFLAYDNNNVELVKLLLDHGADPNIKDNYDRTLLYKACRDNNRELVKLLLEHDADVNSKSYNESTPLHEACSNKNLGLAKLLLEHGADKSVNIKDEDGYTPLYWVCSRRGNNTELAKLLIEHGADINVQDKYVGTPLYEACIKGDLDLAKLLLDHGADVNNKDDDKKAPLYGACIINNIELVKLLLEHGAGKDLDINSLPDYITRNREIEDLVLSYLSKNKSKNESIKVRKLYRNKY